MQKIKLEKQAQMGNEIVTFSKGYLLIDDHGPEENWTLTLVDVENIDIFTKYKEDDQTFNLQLKDLRGETYEGTLSVDLIPDRTSTVLLSSAGALARG